MLHLSFGASEGLRSGDLSGLGRFVFFFSPENVTWMSSPFCSSPFGRFVFDVFLFQPTDLANRSLGQSSLGCPRKLVPG